MKTRYRGGRRRDITPTYLCAERVAELLGVHPSSISRGLCNTREIPRYTIGGKNLYRREEVLEFIVRHRRRFGERLKAYDETERPD